MFHVTIMEEVAAGQRSDRLQKAETAQLLKAAQLSSPKRGTRFLRRIRDFINRLKLNGMGRLTTNEARLLTQEC